MNIQEARESTKDLDTLDTDLLLSHTIEKDRTWLYGHTEEEISEEQYQEFLKLAERRRNHEPVAYILGKKEFMLRSFKVNEHTLIPRPSTEVLVEQTLCFLSDMDTKVREADTDVVVWSKQLVSKSPNTIVDIGTGSGCVGITLALERPEYKVIATDISSQAIEVAKDNAKTLKIDDGISFMEGSLLEPIASLRENFLLVSNPPYIPSGEEVMKDVHDHEPHSALYAGPEGLDVLIPLLEAAKAHPWCIGFVVECRKGQQEHLANFV